MITTVLVVNPRSAGGKTATRWPRMAEIIRDSLGPFEPRFTAGPGDATGLTRAALAQGAELVVAVGGDGTINEVVNGFFDEDGAPLGAQAAFGVLPAGTGGDFVRTIGTSRELEKAAAELRDAAPRPIDVGRVSYIGPDGAQLSRHFVNITSFGLSGEVDRRVNQSSKILGGRASFALATLRAGLAYRSPEVSLRIDDQPARQGRISTVAVANGRYFGGGMMVAPHALIDDGLFDVVTIGEMGLSDILLRGLDIYAGKHLGHANVRVERARRVEALPADGSEPVLLDVDGEQPGRLPASFETLPGALRLRAVA